jgi:hypothetical protein
MGTSGDARLGEGKIGLVARGFRAVRDEQYRRPSFRPVADHRRRCALPQAGNHPWPIHGHPPPQAWRTREGSASPRPSGKRKDRPGRMVAGTSGSSLYGLPGGRQMGSTWARLGFRWSRTWSPPQQPGDDHGYSAREIPAKSQRNPCDIPWSKPSDKPVID